MVQQVRAALYARVSREEQVEGYSLDAQRRAFRALVEGREGWTIHREYIEEGKSAHTDQIRKRPVFKEAIEDAVAGRYEVLVVHKIDRFSRKLRITLEYFEKLGKAGVGFVSIENQIDYSIPTGKFMLVMQGGLAELYSDNLSEETKKGWHERRDQGLYCGLLPFGAIKGEGGIPVSHPDTYPGLRKAFEMAAEGKTDREIARALNLLGYRTAGNQGNRPFSNDTVRGILTNRFYLGVIGDGNGGWLPAKHSPFIEQDLWDRAQAARQRNRRFSHSSTPDKKRVTSLTGVAHCWRCKGRIHSFYSRQGEARVGCSSRAKGWDCSQKSSVVSVFDDQLQQHLELFHIPEDYQAQILGDQKRLIEGHPDIDVSRRRLQDQLARAKELYEWGDHTRQEYQVRRETILKELRALTIPRDDDAHLDRLAGFLRHVGSAWEDGDQSHRNKLARCLFDEIWLQDAEVVAVRPRAEFEPFFRLSYEASVKENVELATRMGFEPTISAVTGRYVRPATPPGHSMTNRVYRSHGEFVKRCHAPCFGPR